MFKKRKLAVAVGIAFSAMSMSALACDPPTITSFTMSHGIVDGVSVGVLEGTIPECNEGTYYPQVRLSGNSVLETPVAATGNFSIPLVADGGAAPTTYTMWAEIRLNDKLNGSVVANTENIQVDIVAANLPTVSNQAESVPENGGRIFTFTPPEENNCPLTTDTTQAESRTDNYCLVEFTQGNPVVTQEGDVIVGASTPGTQQTVAWQISKIAYGNVKKQLSTGSVTATTDAQDGDFSLAVPATVQATQEISASISEAGAKLAVSQNEAQSWSQSGELGYLVEFTSMPTGLTASAVDGEITVSGKLMESGNLTIAYTPKRVLADGTVIPLAERTVDLTATIPASGVSVPAAHETTRYESLTLTPSVANGVCESVSEDTVVVPPEGQCIFTWTDTGSLSAYGIVLTGTPTDAGTINAAWKVEFAYGENRIQLDSGTTTITIGDAATPSMTLNAPAATKALALTRYEAHVRACQVAGDQAAATTLAQQSGKPACFLETSLPQDFLLEAVAPQPDVTGGQDAWMFLISGTYSGTGSKTASFTLNKVLPDGSVITASPLQGATTVTGHGYDFKLDAPVRARSTKTATASLLTEGVACELTADTETANLLSTQADQRKCIVSYTAPEDWTAGLDALSGTIPETGDVTLQWQVTYPLQIGEEVHNISLASGSKTITGYTPTEPVFRVTGKELTDGVIGTNLKGDMGSLVVDQGTNGLNLTATVLDADGNVLAEIPSVAVKNPRTLRIASLGEAQMFAAANVKVRVAYAGDDADVFSEETLQVVRIPERRPGIRITAPKRAKIGVDTDILVQLGEVSRGTFSNDPERIGVWKVRLAKVNSDKTLSYITEYQTVSAANGEATITVPANDTWVGQPLVGVATLDTTFEAAAKTLNTTAFTVQEYVWPTFDMEVKQTAAFAPSNVRLRLVPSDRRFLGQSVAAGSKATYTWSFPDGVTVKKASGPVAYVSMDQAGQYEVTLTIEDETGSTESVTKTIQVAEPAPYEVDLKMYSVNKWPTRAPAAFTLRPVIAGGHPRDRIASYRLTVDGQEVHNDTGRPRYVAFDASGEHTVQLDVTSTMGATGTVTKTLTLAENQAPQCELTQKVSRGIGSVVARCSDVDGKIVRYSWVVDGQEKTSTRNYYSFPVAPNGSTVEVTATDDAGGSTTMTTAVSAQ